MAITVVFDPPLPTDPPATFDSKAFTLLGDLNDFASEANALQADVNAKEGTATTAAATATTQAGIATGAASTATTKASEAVNARDLAVQAASDAEDAAAAAALFDPANYVAKAGNVTMTGPLSVPAGASGAQVPQAQEVAPPGLVAMFARDSAPAGWLKANGAAVSRMTYAALFAAIGTTFGVGDGSTTFNLPDMRGEFPRGFDDGRGVDAGRVFGSAQQDAFQGHRHLQSQGGALSTAVNAAGAYIVGNQNTSETQATTTDPVYGTVRQASETRPRNIALLACIKF